MSWKNGQAQRGDKEFKKRWSQYKVETGTVKAQEILGRKNKTYGKIGWIWNSKAEEV